MAKQGFQHSEAFLQWIWENLLFEIGALQTDDGKSLQIIKQGSLNHSDGPDFKHAILEIEGVRWHGDVEIHTESNHWDAHNHQINPDYNTVVLHVVAEEEKPQQVYTENGSRPYVINLWSYLSPQLHLFLNSFQNTSSLPCSSSLNFISEDAFYRQLQKAHLEYFEKKADDFLRLYDPELMPSTAWKHALVLSIWDGLGISHNRRAMQQTASKWLEARTAEVQSLEDDLELAFNAAGFEDALSNIQWNYKGMRPASHPRRRIPEAVRLSRQVLDEPFENMLHKSATEAWKHWLEKAGIKSTSRYEILFGTVYLPALYVLGSLFVAHTLKETALQRWKRLKSPIPATLLEPFKKFDLEDQRYQKKLGSVHQIKAYCRAGQCSKCFVLKKAIQS
ncbi:DUF2851 family protein [Gracilimonas mengyeensis]|uniref:DUF2851 domain-containing protein n=1 Tax=Gracilimonas mengyeensis TaxID=1302730 RepID=A0A521E2A0_9BACT|nr:DUF2851 family protein [Gracilimonas mengyeensis]SMO77955.1 Protein of unknown function [Gracilimonas mengyeensis]